MIFFSRSPPDPPFSRPEGLPSGKRHYFDTFGIIHVVTQGGPANATEILVYKVYNDGFIGLDLGGSAAQSVILMFIVISLTVIQFRFIEKKVEYK